MALQLRTSTLENWYVIERADGGRVSDAQVEGTAEQVLAIAEAITERSSACFKRCAVECAKHYVRLWSPRNSQQPACVGIGDADALAADILRKLGTTSEPEEN